MLVISRKIGERILIEGGIIIQVLSVDALGKFAKIGIVAPQNSKIVTDEIHANIQSDTKKRSSLAQLI